MSALIRRSLSPVFLLAAVLVLGASCGRTSHDAIGSGGAGAADATNSSSGKSGAESTPAGAPAIIDPSGAARPCVPQDAPGQPCDAERCWGSRCGVPFMLTCHEGTWESADSSPAWELVCPAPPESVYDIDDIKQGACCGSLLPRNDVYSEPPSCGLCPDTAPQDGDLCSLPNDCAPAVIDCFYKCCCYGDLIWAQCDGKAWHVATNCSPK